MKAIETVYKGHRFRSRLEARWSIFFDEMGIPFQYEPEGFQFSDGTHYLPDFYLPEQKAWVEIKGGEISREDEHKVKMLSRSMGRNVYVFGDLPRVDYQDKRLDGGEYPFLFIKHNYGTHYGFSPEREEWNKEFCAWYVCPWCNQVSLGFVELGNNCKCLDAIEALLSYPQDPFEDYFWYLSKINHLVRDTNDHPRLMQAYLTASQARFEHGEQG